MRPGPSTWSLPLKVSGKYEKGMASDSIDTLLYLLLVREGEIVFPVCE